MSSPMRSPTGTRIRLRSLSDSTPCFPSLRGKGTGANAAPVREFTEPSLFLCRSNDSVEKTSARGRKKPRDEKPHESSLCARASHVDGYFERMKSVTPLQANPTRSECFCRSLEVFGTGRGPQARRGPASPLPSSTPSGRHIFLRSCRL